MSATARLCFTVLWRDRWQLLLWIGGITLLVFASASAIVTEFAGAAERASIVAIVVTNPAFLFLRGTPDGITTAALFYFQAFTFVAVLAGLMSTFSVVRNTRADEDSGRAEMLAAVPLRREAFLGTALLEALVANLLMGAGITAALLSVGFGFTGSALSALATAGVGLVFAAVAAVAAQAMPSARGANGVAAGTVGLAYLLRGIGDALGDPSADLTAVEPGWASWLSPIGWAQRVSPFGDARPALLLLNVALAAGLITVALVVSRRRDLGASLLHTRPGPASATAVERTSIGVAWKHQVPALIGWMVGAAVLASLAGALAPTVASALADNASLSELIARLAPGTQTDVVDVFVTALLGICGILAAAAGVQALLRVHSEESEGRAELILATPTSRTRWFLGHTVVAVLSVVAVVLVAGLAAGLGFVATGDDGGWIVSSIEATTALIPAALIIVGVVALAYAAVPRLAVPLGWGAFVAALVLGQFGDLLRLPLWAQNISPFHHSSALPLEPLDVVATAVMTAIAVVTIAVAAVLFERRDIVS